MVGMKMAVYPLHVRPMCPMRFLVLYELLSCFPVCVWFVVTLMQSLLFFLCVHSLWADATCSGVLLSAFCTFECPLIVVLALVGVMSSCVISAGLDFRPACPGMVAVFLAIEARLRIIAHIQNSFRIRPFVKGPNSEVPLPSGKSGGLSLSLSKLPSPYLSGLQILCCSTLSSVWLLVPIVLYDELLR